MAYGKRFFLPVLYLLLASIATSVFFGVLVFLNSLGITFHYYRVCVLEAVLLSRELDLYALWFSTLVVLVAMASLTMTYGRGEPVEYLPMLLLGVGSIALIGGLVTSGAILILVGQVLALMTGAIYRAGSALFFSKKRIQAQMVVYLLSLVLMVEWPALIYWVVAAFRPGNVLGREAAVLETNLVYAASSLSPWLYSAFLFAWLWVPLVLFLRRKIVGKNLGNIVEPSVSATSANVGTEKPWSMLLPALFLLGLSVFVGYYPYWHGPDWLVGTDAYWIYKGPLDGMAGMNRLDGFGQALKEHQSGFLILLLGLMRITGFSSHVVLRYTPMALVATTAVATFWLARTLGLGREVALLSGLASIMLMPTSIGIFTSILANWFALILWMTFLAILIKRDSQLHAVGAAILGSLFSLVILLIHPWSWGPFAAVTCLFLLAEFLGRWLSNRQLAFCTTFGFAGLVGCLSLLMLQTSQGSRIMDALRLGIRGFLDPRAVLTFPDSIEYFATMWSPFLNPVLVVVAIAGILAAASYGRGLRRLLLSWLCVTSVASVLATALGYWGGGYLWRVFFIAPISVPTAIGASYICRTIERKLREDSQVTVPSTYWYWLIGVIVSTLGTSVASVVMSIVFPELGLLLGLVLNLLFVTLFFHSAYEGVGISHILGVAMVLLIATSGLRSIAPLLVDPHNISLG